MDSKMKRNKIEKGQIVRRTMKDTKSDQRVK